MNAGISDTRNNANAGGSFGSFPFPHANAGTTAQTNNNRASGSSPNLDLPGYSELTHSD